MPILNTPNLDQASIYTDLSSLDKIRQQGQVDEVGAIKKAAQEFEAFFMNMMLKSMRQASGVIGGDNPFSSQQEKMFIGMLDEQLSVDLSQGGHLKIADLMVAELTRSKQVAQNSDELSEHLKKIQPSTATEQSVELSTTPLPLATDDKQPINAVTVNALTPISPFEALNPANKSEASSMQISTDDKAKELPTKKALFERASDFIETLMPYAKQAAEKLSVDPRLLIAQAALETGWGKFVMHDAAGNPGFNLFGIKAGANWQGDSIQIDTLEVEQQQFKKVNASFRKYNNLAESFSDYVNFIADNPRYREAVQAASQADQYVEQLQSSGYATDPNYANKIMRIFNTEALQKLELDSD